MARFAFLLTLTLFASIAATAPAQPMLGEEQPDLAIDTKIAHAVVERVLKNLNEAYIFPETAKKMEADLRKRLENKEFDDPGSAKKLADSVTEHMQTISKDKHLRVFYVYRSIPEPPRQEKPEPEHRVDGRDEMREFLRQMNFGFEKVERLEGNVGYLDLRGFFSAELGGETATAAMNFLANTDAMIIDLRKNGGGDPAMVALICSYLFPDEPVHLNDLYSRPEDSTHQWWTLPFVPGRRYVGKPVYVLTSTRTFSAAEEFTYNLKSLKRATIVGEITGGGAHPGEMRKLHDHFEMFLPTGRAINPITKTNWEGTGVAPDVKVPAEAALTTAHLAAIKKVAEQQDLSKKPADPGRRERIQKLIKRLEKELAQAPGSNKLTN
jgi:retinol-binding protein 3